MVPLALTAESNLRRFGNTGIMQSGVTWEIPRSTFLTEDTQRLLEKSGTIVKIDTDHEPTSSSSTPASPEAKTSSVWQRLLNWISSLFDSQKASPPSLRDRALQQDDTWHGLPLALDEHGKPIPGSYQLPTTYPEEPAAALPPARPRPVTPPLLPPVPRPLDPL